MAPRLSAVILAAGFSSRMGELKALLPLGGRTVLEQGIRLFRECGMEEVVVVLGHRAGEVGAIAQRAGARTVNNPDFTAGMYSSIRAGVRQISSWSQGFFLLPVDIPLVRPGTIGLLTKAFMDAPSRIFYPVFDDRRGHPPLIATELIPVLIEPKNPGGGLRSLLATLEARQPEQVREVQVADANILFDMDTREDYLAGCRRWERDGVPTPAECEAILRHFHPMPEKGLAHGRRVAEIAAALCAAVNRNSGQALDAELCWVSGLLHDIAKGHASHEREGGRWLRDFGFDRAAAIVAAHRDLDWTPDLAISEKEIVHLADKLARGNRIVGIVQRFEENLVFYRNDPEAAEAIRNRYAQALQLATAVEAAAGRRIDDILFSFQPHAVPDQYPLSPRDR